MTRYEPRLIKWDAAMTYYIWEVTLRITHISFGGGPEGEPRTSQ